MAIALKSRVLASSTFGQGRNVYLSEKHFWMMIGAAALLHLVILLAMEFWPEEEVTEIPVRALNIKLGDGQSWQLAMPEPEAASSPAAAPQQQANTPAEPKPQSQPVPELTGESAVQGKMASSKSPEPAAAESGAGRPAFKQEAPKPKPAPKVKPKRIKISEQKPNSGIPTQTDLPKMRTGEVSQATAAPAAPVRAAPLPPPAIAETPRQFVRRNAPVATPSDGQPAEGADGSSKAMIARYEQKISQWLAKHKHYPSAARMLGQHGEPTLRIRIDRQGNIKFYGIERSSGYQLIDEAAIDMAKRANPLPAPPQNYPGDRLLEFLIPVSFDLE